MTRLVFVYNADTGFFNLATDIAHKIFSPATYPCRLCAITHGFFSVRKEWEKFVAEAPLPLEFLHRNEFLSRYPGLASLQLPSILYCEGERCREWLRNADLASMNSVSDLRAAILGRLSDEPPTFP